MFHVSIDYFSFDGNLNLSWEIEKLIKEKCWKEIIRLNSIYFYILSEKIVNWYKLRNVWKKDLAMLFFYWCLKIYAFLEFIVVVHLCIMLIRTKTFTNNYFTLFYYQ